MTIASKATAVLLALNGGSSSIKFGLYQARSSLPLVLKGRIERIGLSPTVFSLTEGEQTERRELGRLDFQAAVDHLVEWLLHSGFGKDLRAIGHRVVYGGNRFCEPQELTPSAIEELRQLSPLDPEHLPGEIAMVETLAAHFPDLPQIACFDTAFHKTLPTEAKLLPLPRRLYAYGVRRYGFHGLSYAFLMEELQQLAGRKVAQGKVILAHLGSGASLAAVENGRCRETTMGFSPASGLPMGTRSGELDPGLVWFLHSRLEMGAWEIYRMAVEESGLLGVSERSPDFQELLRWEKEDVRAREATSLFCYHVRKAIGALVAVLGGLDALVFSGGIGANSPEARERSCQGLKFFGIELDPERNLKGDRLVSSSNSRVSVWAIPTDEEQMIARYVWRKLFSHEGETGAERQEHNQGEISRSVQENPWEGREK
jgi:acetate kinase